MSQHNSNSVRESNKFNNRCTTYFCIKVTSQLTSGFSSSNKLHVLYCHQQVKKNYNASQTMCTVTCNLPTLALTSGNSLTTTRTKSSRHSKFSVLKQQAAQVMNTILNFTQNIKYSRAKPSHSN